MSKRNIITLVLGILCVTLIVVGILLIVKDMSISNEVAAEGERVQAEILALGESEADKAKALALQADFQAYLDSKTPVQTALTIVSILLLGGGIYCFTSAVKRLSADRKAKKEKEGKD